MVTSMLSISCTLIGLFFPQGYVCLRLPEYIQACDADDDLNKCAKEQAIATIKNPKFIGGDARYGIPQLEPLFIPRMVIEQGNKQVGLKMDLKDVYLHGLSHIQVLDMKMDLKNMHMSGNYLVPLLTMLSQYEMDGHILVLPVKGKGKANNTLVNLKIFMEMDYHLENLQGKEYLRFHNHKMTIDADHLYVNYENLFDGDQALGNTINRFINENWREVFKDIGPAVGDGIGAFFRLIFDNLVKNVPYKSLYNF